MPELPPSIVRTVRAAIYSAVVNTGTAPPAVDLARTLDLEARAVEDAYQSLADAHVIVLRPGTAEVLWAPPFSAVPTGFQSAADGARWFAPCAWDVFGIPAALGRDATIEARCGWSGEPISCEVRRGRAHGAGVIHLLVPAAHFWDDIVHT